MFVVVLAPGVDGSSSMQNPVHSLERLSGLYTGPYFDSTTSTNITTQLGTHAYLPCKVKQLGNKSVSIIIPKLGIRVGFFFVCLGVLD